MTRLSWLAASAVAVLASACAGHQSASSETHNAMAGSSMSAAPSTSEPAPAAPAMSEAAPPAQPAPAPSTAATNYTDAQLRSFATAATQIDPISRTLATATPEQRTAAVAQIRAILQRNNLDEATYNAIAARASADPTFAARIRTLHEANG